jgi:hypothetical protein
MRAILTFAVMLAGAVSVQAQESCDVRSTVEKIGSGIVFRQLMFCGDSDPVTTLTCTPGKPSIRASLPIGDVEKGKGEKQIVTMEIGGKPVRKRLRITSANTSEIMLESGDALRNALLSPGTDIPVTYETFSTSIGILKQSADSLADWKAQCGIE